jgi:hypothetical protein
VERDDFVIWTNYADYFYGPERRINEILSKEVNFKKAPFPKNEDEFADLLKKNGLDIASIRDGYGNPVLLTSRIKDRYVDQITYENGKQVIKPVSDKLLVFAISGHSLDPSGPLVELTTFSTIITAIYAGTPGAAIDVTAAYYMGERRHQRDHHRS